MTLEEATPSGSTGLVPAIDEVSVDALPCTKVTVPPLTVTGVAIESVLVSALVDVIVQVETPAALVAEQAL